MRRQRERHTVGMTSDADRSADDHDDGRAFITGIYNGATVALSPISSSQVLGLVPAGTLTDFESNEAAYSCLNGASLNVYDNVNGTTVAEAITPTDCIAQDFAAAVRRKAPGPRQP